MNLPPTSSSPQPQRDEGGYPPPGSTTHEVRVRLPQNKPVVTYALLGFTILIYLLQMLSQYLFQGNDLLFIYGGKINSMILAGQVWRLITPVFLHGSILHILFNMYALFIFGSRLEQFYGHGRFAILYFLGGFAGNVISFAFSPNPALGSSTAVFALVAADGMFFYQNRRLFGAGARSIIMNTLLIVVINLFIGFQPGSSIDNWGHLGGLMGGVLFAWLGGPHLKVEGLPPTLHVVDERSMNQVQFATLGVLIVFGGLAVARFLLYYLTTM
jgi:rhomboid protease GluP